MIKKMLFCITYKILAALIARLKFLPILLLTTADVLMTVILIQEDYFNNGVTALILLLFGSLANDALYF